MVLKFEKLFDEFQQETDLKDSLQRRKQIQVTHGSALNITRRLGPLNKDFRFFSEELYEMNSRARECTRRLEAILARPDMKKYKDYS
ncbi:Oidioi.mRNA.OKI2018_I69.PAR.g10725.t1.cds [Oikopleura dioica]|uniref:Oidioi.mRNA.OKI2018_I69.PAR.g10725.t1.cds n=1 Tax=Oikopleura dioica TaxID=34765 RepID=A0ABN7RS16_OIKDI|nr:Oidioi.mRNA.OKI2018_I69.PAR.g10725.t1.cds [Oikopleura dioica]